MVITLNVEPVGLTRSTAQPHNCGMPDGMWMELRAWWYLQTKPTNMPRDVREYVVRRDINKAVKAVKTPEQKRRLSTRISELALTGNGVSLELLGEMLATSMSLLDGAPMGECAQCRRPIVLHEAVNVGSVAYCQSCGTLRRAEVSGF